MNTVINATWARNNFFDLLIATRDKKKITNIKLDGVVVADLVPHVEQKIDWDKYEKECEEGLKYLRSVGWEENKDFRKKFKFRKW